MFEHRDQQLIPSRHFYHRLIRSAVWAFMVMGVSLLAGICGYHFVEGQPWIDALLNASMILGGMGPVDPLKTVAGKVFASFYALYSGLVLIALMALMLAPVFHRILHSFNETKNKP